MRVDVVKKLNGSIFLLQEGLCRMDYLHFGAVFGGSNVAESIFCPFLKFLGAQGFGLVRPLGRTPKSLST